jgi:uncharacterized membrane protein required for colicin V production
MVIDAICILIVAGLAVMGWFQGLLAQLVRIAALVVAFAAAGYGAALVPDSLVQGMSQSPAVRHLAAAACLWLVVYIAVRIVGGLFIHTVRRHGGAIAFLDGVGGVALGAVKGALIAYFGLAAVSAAREPLQKLAPQYAINLSGSAAARLVREHNILDRLPAVPGLNLSALPVPASGQPPQPPAQQKVQPSQPPGGQPTQAAPKHR